MIYIDADLKTYRCTYTVGNKNFSTGTWKIKTSLAVGTNICFLIFPNVWLVHLEVIVLEVAEFPA